MNASAITSEQETGLSLSELMMLPVILLWLTFQAFAQHVVKLKELRRTRPLPKTWREHWPNLRLAEWHIRELTASGIEQICSGKDLDLHQLSMDPDPPEDFGLEPASALEMHRRFEAIARFHADPERYIRRAAQRITARDGEINPLGRANPRPSPPPPPLVVVVVVVMVVVVFLSATGFSPQRIRAPPSRRKFEKCSPHRLPDPHQRGRGRLRATQSPRIAPRALRFSLLSSAYFAAGTSAL
jgi:hypothetical protein